MDLTKFQKNGRFLMLAFDHRSSFKKLINPANPDLVTDEQAIAAKKEVIDALRGEFSSLLIDQEIGLKSFEPKDTPFLLPLEKSGYDQQGKERVTKIEYSLESLEQLGASGAKLLLWFNPYAKTAQVQIETARDIMNQCKQKNFPYFLEIRTYNDVGDEADKMEDWEREEIVLASLKMLIKEGIVPNVYKLEYPGSALGCQTITAILEEIPWILLTMGTTFEQFSKQLEEASIRGCKGFLAGRALWQEVCSLEDEEKRVFLEETLPQRFKILSNISEVL